MNTEKKRPLRVADVIKEEISKMLIRGLKDPRLAMANITYVKVTNDLSLAKVYFRVMKESFDVDQVIKGFERAENFIRRALRDFLEIRTVPQLKFYYDDSLEYGERIENIFRRIKDESSEE